MSWKGGGQKGVSITFKLSRKFKRFLIHLLNFKGHRSGKGLGLKGVSITFYYL